jgi:hypothetical protein
MEETMRGQASHSMTAEWLGDDGDFVFGSDGPTAFGTKLGSETDGVTLFGGKIGTTTTDDVMSFGGGLAGGGVEDVTLFGGKLGTGTDGVTLFGGGQIGGGVENGTGGGEVIMFAGGATQAGNMDRMGRGPDMFGDDILAPRDSRSPAARIRHEAIAFERRGPHPYLSPRTKAWHRAHGAGRRISISGKAFSHPRASFADRGPGTSG